MRFLKHDFYHIRGFKILNPSIIYVTLDKP